MIRALPALLLVVTCTCFAPGCARSRDEAPKPKIVGFPRGDTSDGTKREPRLIGRIMMVNADGNFVLVSCDAWAAPVAGTALKCLRNGVETAIVNVGPERRGAYVTADIVTGSPARGDQVFQ